VSSLVNRGDLRYDASANAVSLLLSLDTPTTLGDDPGIGLGNDVLGGDFANCSGREEVDGRRCRVSNDAGLSGMTTLVEPEPSACPDDGNGTMVFTLTGVGGSCAFPLARNRSYS